MLDLSPHISSGTGVWWSQAGAEPTPLVHALLDQADEIGTVRAFCGLSWDRRLVRELPSSVSLSSYGALGQLRRLSRAGRLDVVPCHYSALPRLFADGALPADVGFVQVSPPDADGTCSLGIGVDYIADAIAHTPVLIAEINRRMPATTGTPRLPLSRFAAVVETDRAISEAPPPSPDKVEQAIAHHVAELVEDGDTLQMGVGSLPAAVLDLLSGHRDLGIHTGMISDGVLRLAEKGVLTGARKEIDPGVIVTGAALGSFELYDGLGRLPVEFRPASYTHSPKILSRLSSLVSINSAIEVDLTGQVCAERRRGEYVGAVGGQVDFSRAAALTGARSIITVRATSGEDSAIVPTPRGPVTTGKSDVDFVVTEFGVADLRGRSLQDRAHRLVAVAAPEHREALLRAMVQ